MTTDQIKRECIKKGYIELFDDQETAEERFSEIEHYISKDGWFSGTLFNVHISKLQVSGHLCRPKTLQRINDNNGWTRIEPDGSNLPVNYSAVYQVGLLNPDGKFVIYQNLDSLSQLERGFRNGYATHYKTIDKLKPMY